ncbi:MAG: helix-turn-helix transcriptional regulator, partial [Gemmatimonadetes bacterium]|nr:helix-turn-helix transcriptional regulator [Gemmatimonadota bacterium]
MLTVEQKSHDKETPAATVIDARARHHYWAGRGQLSVKTFRGGAAMYAVGGTRVRVDDASFLVLNDQQDYEIEIDATTPIESFCVFFPSSMVGEVLRLGTMTDGALLDDPEALVSVPQLAERTRPRDEVVTPAIDRVRQALRSGVSEGELARQSQALLRCILRLAQVDRQESTDLGALKTATREELYRRLHRARDYMSACPEDRLTNHDLASVACLSPGHFERCFQELFGQTPHRFLTGVRLQRA